MSFSALGLHPQILSNLKHAGYQHSTPVQQRAIPEILAGHDVLAVAQTGTGKTAAFTLPLIHQLSQHGQAGTISGIRALVLTPTRELAQQVQASVQKYAHGCDLTSITIYGGASIQQQQQQLAAGVAVVIATPGRLLDHLRRGSLSLSSLQYLVFDEADRMLDMGFKDELKALLSFVPKVRQTLMFSATLDDSIFRFAKPLLSKPKLLEIAKANTIATKIEERVYAVDKQQKAALLSHLMIQQAWQQVLIFSRSKQAADELITKLAAKNIEAAAFHGDLSQAAREQVLAAFKQGEIQALVATDVAARGLDIEELKYVVNVELPFKAEDYIHRIGRTGRAGKAGIAITLLSVDDEHLLTELEILLDRRLPQQWLEGFEPDLTKAPPVNKKNSRSAQKRKARQRALGSSAKSRKR
ncbi:DEAD/DEAH box helicase [Agarivorans sp. MS3-6]|uniref:DEAD/DEAH box helicase n=1 Tax=Agarivorans sp. TSD2052 TaxID=2937286 RepID=UPI00200E4606|nr:DEAD/DEAH box helicase [Agarivorans sp. TSD2052]UPW19521.1 DEAD/DEAH box helicase [Agarivorans sp. TSD2052]